jgi:hypothetical protein
MTRDTTLRQHTIASITLETGNAKRTVQRWVKKCGDIGILRDNTRYFSESEKTQILSHQSKSNTQRETIEAELVEPGAIELHTSEGRAAAPLVRFDLDAIELNLPASDTTALDAHTAQLEQVVRQNASAIAQSLTARFQGGIKQIVAEQDNLLQGIRAQALNGGAEQL